MILFSSASSIAFCFLSYLILLGFLGTGSPFCGRFPIRPRRRAAQGARRPFLVEKLYVRLNERRHVVAMGRVEIDEHLDFGPPVHGLHRPVVRRRSSAGHRMREMILGEGAR